MGLGYQQTRRHLAARSCDSAFTDAAPRTCRLYAHTLLARCPACTITSRSSVRGGAARHSAMPLRSIKPAHHLSPPAYLLPPSASRLPFLYSGTVFAALAPRLHRVKQWVNRRRPARRCRYSNINEKIRAYHTPPTFLATTSVLPSPHTPHLPSSTYLRLHTTPTYTLFPTATAPSTLHFSLYAHSSYHLPTTLWWAGWRDRLVGRQTVDVHRSSSLPSTERYRLVVHTGREGMIPSASFAPSAGRRAFLWRLCAAIGGDARREQSKFLLPPSPHHQRDTARHRHVFLTVVTRNSPNIKTDYGRHKNISAWRDSPLCAGRQPATSDSNNSRSRSYNLCQTVHHQNAKAYNR